LKKVSWKYANPLLFTGSLSGFKKWVEVPPGSGYWVAAFNNNGYEVADGFHTLTAPGYSKTDRFYNAFVFGHGTDGHTAYGYLAGYARKRKFYVVDTVSLLYRY